MQPCMEFTHWRRGLSHTQGESRNPSLAQGSEAAALSSALRQQGVAVAADRPGRCCVLLCVRVCGHRSRSGRPSTASAMLRSASMATHRCGQQQQPSGQGRLQHTQHSSQCHIAQVWTVQPDVGLDLHARQEGHGHMTQLTLVVRQAKCCSAIKPAAGPAVVSCCDRRTPQQQADTQEPHTANNSNNTTPHTPCSAPLPPPLLLPLNTPTGAEGGHAP